MDSEIPDFYDKKHAKEYLFILLNECIIVHTQNGEKLKPLTLKFLERDIDEIDKIISEGKATRKYESRSDFIRVAVQELIERENKKIEEKRLAETIRSAIR